MSRSQRTEPRRRNVPMVKPPQLPRWLPALGFVVVTVVFFAPHLFGERFFWEDFVEQFYPMQVFAVRHWARAVLPFWNPYTFCGMPFLADPQVGFFYPPHWLLGMVMLLEGTLPVWWVQLVVIAHFVVAQWGAYALCRAVGASTAGAVVAGIGYGLSGVLTHHVIHPMIVYHLSWLPWVLLLLWRALRERSWWWAVWSGMLLGMSLHAGHPQTVLYEYVLLLAFVGWTVFAQLRARELGAAEALLQGVRGITPLAIGVGLFAVQLLSTQELAQLSERAEGAGLEWAAEVSLMPQQLVTLVVPRFFGSTLPPGERHVPLYLEGTRYYHYWETAFYIGVGTLLLALVGIPGRWRTPQGAFWLVAVLVALVFAFGKYAPLFPLLYELPGFRLFRVPPRALFVVALGLCIFAAWGFDELWQQPRRHLSRLLWAGTPLAAIALMTATGTLPALLSTPAPWIEQVRSEGATALWLFLLAFGVALLLWRGWLPPAVAAVMLAVVVAVDLTIAHAPFTRSRQDPERLLQMPQQLKAMLQPKPPQELFRVSMRDDFGMAMLRNQGMLDSILLFEGYNQLRLERRNPPMPTAEATFDLLSIRYRIALDTPTRQMYFRQRPSAFSWAWMRYRAQVVPSESTEVVLRSGAVDPHREVLLEEPPPLQLSGAEPQEVAHRLRCLQYEHNWQRWEVETAQPGLLCLSEIWYPAWRARVDGAPVPVLRAYHSLRALPVPAGRHVVELFYDSAAFRRGAWVSAITAALCVIALGVLWSRHHRR
jgi:hypothetical protein